jgi:V8-like Glu-specific endopeptidase
MTVPSLLAAVAFGLLGLATPAARSGAVPTSRSADGFRRVGVLFANATSTQHDCTASVVDSPHGDLLLTAAHCVSGSGAGLVFVPGFHDGEAPYGRWTVTAAHLARGWLKREDPRQDFAVLTVAPLDIDGATREIEGITGGYVLGAVPSAGAHVTVPGYPAGVDNNPITCRTTVYFTRAFPSFDCRGYVGGTSGSPWLVRTPAGQRIVGVIGGLNEGGCVDSISYSPRLAQAAQDVYVRAVNQETPDLAPVPGGDGCS